MKYINEYNINEYKEQVLITIKSTFTEIEKSMDAESVYKLLVNIVNKNIYHKNFCKFIIVRLRCNYDIWIKWNDYKILYPYILEIAQKLMNS